MIIQEIFDLIEERNFLRASDLIEKIENESLKLLYTANLLRAQDEGKQCSKIIQRLIDENNTHELSYQILLEARLVQARNYWRQSKFDLTIESLTLLHVEEANIMVLEDGNEILGFSFSLLGSCHHVKGEYDLAKREYQKAIRYRENHGNEGQLALTLVNLAALHQEKSEFGKSLEYNKNALAINEKLGRKDQLTLILNNIGNLYRSQGKLIDSLNYYEIAEKIALEIDSEDLSTLVIFNKAYTYQLFGEFAQAIHFYDICLKYYEKMDFEEDLANLKNNLGYIHWRSGNTENAISELIESLELRKKFGNVYTISETLLMLIRVGSAESEIFRDEMEKIMSENSNDRILDVRYKLAKALLDKQNKRLIDKLTSMKLFQEITDGEIIDYEVSIVALTNLCELLLLEFKSTESEEILLETQKYLSKLKEITITQNMVVLQIQVLVLESKLNIILLNVEKAELQLTSAYEIAKEKQMKQMKKMVEKEQEMLLNQVNLWNQATISSEAIIDRFKTQKIDEYLDLVFG